MLGACAVEFEFLFFKMPLYAISLASGRDTLLIFGVEGVLPKMPFSLVVLNIAMKLER